MDRDAELLGDRGCQHVDAVAVGRVDPVLAALTGDVDPEIARQAEERSTVAVLFLAEDHDRVAASTLHDRGVSDAAEVGRVRIGPFPRVGTDEQVVHRRAVVGLEDLVEARDALDVGCAGVRRPDHSGRAGDRHHHREDDRQRERAPAPACSPAGLLHSCNGTVDPSRIRGIPAAKSWACCAPTAVGFGVDGRFSLGGGAGGRCRRRRTGGGRRGHRARRACPRARRRRRGR